MIDIVQLSLWLSAIASSGKIVESALNLFSKGMDANYGVLKAEADTFAKDQVSKDNIDTINDLASSIPSGTFEAVTNSVDALQKRALTKS
jgi:hypothetical protein